MASAGTVDPPESRPPRSLRRVRRHALLAVASVGLCLLVDGILGADDVRVRLSMSTAYASLTFLGTTLVLGPVRVLRGRHSPANTYLRRDLGIWAGLLGLLHAGAGLTVHFRGDMWKYFLSRAPSSSHPLPLRFDLFGLANYTGTASALILLLLLALSNDWSLRSLGTSRWKGLQRWNYAAFALMALHGGAFQALESRAIPWITAFALSVMGVALLQTAGYARVRRG